MDSLSDARYIKGIGLTHMGEGFILYEPASKNKVK